MVRGREHSQFWTGWQDVAESIDPCEDVLLSFPSPTQAVSRMRRQIDSGAPSPAGPYSPAIVAGRYLFLASQGPLDPATGDLVGGDAATQARQVLSNIGAICSAAGATLDDVVRVQLYLADLEDLPSVNTVFREVFGEPFPARSTFQVGLPGLLVAAEATAYLPAETAESEREGGRS
jgi:2-iminobutanoate/2-iminopropanoate deaminase